MLNNLYLSIKYFVVSWINVSLIQKLDTSKFKVCFYFETISDWHHLGGIVNILEENNINVIKLISDTEDKKLSEKNTFYIGYGSARTYIFNNIKIRNFVLSLTDLNNFHLKKSKFQVKYYYVFHSIISTHRAYYKDSFDNYDVIFCVGNHHINEIRSRESKYNLKQKKLIKHGYGKLDFLIEQQNSKEILTNINKQTNLLIAPTWGENSLNEKEIILIINEILKSKLNIKITIRPHTMTVWNKPNFINNIKNNFKNNVNIIIENDLNLTNSILTSDLMISDWSGAAIEFAFLKKKPVIFIETIQKTRNFEWDLLELPTIEKELRKKIGFVLKKNDINKIKDVINQVTLNSNNKNIEVLMSKTIFNVNKSAKIASDEIIKNL